MKASGCTAAYVVCDVTDEKQVESMIRFTAETFGRLDYAYNNAGIMSDDVETAELESSEFDRVINVNLRSMFLCLKYELRQMLKQGGEGYAIVNCSSIGGLIGLPGRVAYHASKHAVLGMTKCAALEYASRGIRINAVCPATIETPMVEKCWPAAQSGKSPNRSAVSVIRRRWRQRFCGFAVPPPASSWVRASPLTAVIRSGNIQ